MVEHCLMTLLFEVELMAHFLGVQLMALLFEVELMAHFFGVQLMGMKIVL